MYSINTRISNFWQYIIIHNYYQVNNLYLRDGYGVRKK